jgi:hypothetical protein
MDKFKYYCEKCNYGTDIKNSMALHNNSILHITGTAGKRNVKKKEIKKVYKCENCDYISNNKNNYLVHKLNKHSTKEDRKKEYKFYCELCDFGILSKTSYNKHLDSLTHKNIVEILKKHNIQ